MWRDIALANRDALLAELDGYRAALDSLRDELASGDAAALTARFERAREARHGWHQKFLRGNS
ncbi:bifunctional prephenate dehydrogenase/3-phosphoshikimate 1-carboxyvinyltransferase [compost metagenome]